MRRKGQRDFCRGAWRHCSSPGGLPTPPPTLFPFSSLSISFSPYPFSLSSLYVFLSFHFCTILARSLNCLSTWVVREFPWGFGGSPVVTKSCCQGDVQLCADKMQPTQSAITQLWTLVSPDSRTLPKLNLDWVPRTGSSRVTWRDATRPMAENQSAVGLRGKKGQEDGATWSELPFLSASQCLCTPADLHSLLDNFLIISGL